MEHILVCPFNEKLLNKLKQKALVIFTDDFNIVSYIQKKVNHSNKLHAIRVNTDESLSEINFQERWERLPMAIYSPDFGSYRNFLHKLNILRKLNVRVFLSSENEFNFVALRILSSLNIASGIYFDHKPLNWELLNELMHYAIYSNTKHASIEPFEWVSSNYLPAEYIDFSTVYFNNPSKYLYINEKEQIALTEAGYLDGNFIAEGINALDSITENAKYIEHLNRRYDVMLQLNECSFCPAFRICLGKFNNLENKNATCKSFFTDFLDAADYIFLKNNHGVKLWQL